MSKHVPGPWADIGVDDRDNGGRRVYGGDEIIAYVCGTDEEHTEANAALIARAPTLLRERDELREALVACAAALDPHLDRMLQQQGAYGDTFRANARAEARAVLSKVTP